MAQGDKLRLELSAYVSITQMNCYWATSLHPCPGYLMFLQPSFGVSSVSAHSVVQAAWGGMDLKRGNNSCHQARVVGAWAPSWAHGRPAWSAAAFLSDPSLTSESLSTQSSSSRCQAGPASRRWKAGLAGIAREGSLGKKDEGTAGKDPESPPHPRCSRRAS